MQLFTTPSQFSQISGVIFKTADVIWCHWSCSLLVQVMACHLSVYDINCNYDTNSKWKFLTFIHTGPNEMPHSKITIGQYCLRYIRKVSKYCLRYIQNVSIASDTLERSVLPQTHSKVSMASDTLKRSVLPQIHSKGQYCLRYTRNKESSWYRLCCHWWHCRLS